MPTTNLFFFPGPDKINISSDMKMTERIFFFSVCALHPVPNSPGSLSHLGTLPGSDLVGLGAWVSCADPLVSTSSGEGDSSSELPELEVGTGECSMQLRQEKRTKGVNLKKCVNRKDAFNKAARYFVICCWVIFFEQHWLHEDLCQKFNN